VVERHTLKIADADRGLALRLISALIFAWALVPFATQGRLLRDAALMHDGKPNAVELPAELLAFIEMHKGGA
jgi:hypothetical protein